MCAVNNIRRIQKRVAL